MSMFEDLRNKRALVTGAFGGLGAEFARTLSAAGAGCRPASSWPRNWPPPTGRHAPSRWT
jgi:hypothetical protein